MQTNLRKYLSYRKILKFGPCASQSVAALALFVLRAAAMLRNLRSTVLLLNFIKTFRLYRHLNYWQRAKQRCCCLLHRQARVSVVRNTLESFWCGRKIWFCREKKSKTKQQRQRPFRSSIEISSPWSDQTKYFWTGFLYFLVRARSRRNADWCTEVTMLVALLRQMTLQKRTYAISLPLLENCWAEKGCLGYNEQSVANDSVG